MKRLISFGIVACATAIISTYAFADVTMTAPDKAATGEDFTLTITTTQEIEDVQFTVSAVGLKLKSTENLKDGAMFIAGDNNGVITVAATAAGTSDGVYKANEKLGTVTFTVTAKDGEVINVSLVGDDDYKDMVNGQLLLTIGDKSNETTSSEDSSGSTSNVTSLPSTGDSNSSASSTGTSSDYNSSDAITPNNSSSDDGTDNPNTGIAGISAVSMVVLTATGLLIAKRRTK